VIFTFRHKLNPDVKVFFDAPTKAEAHKKLRTMVDRASEYEEVVQKKKKEKG